MEERIFAKDLIDFIDRSPSMYHSVEEAKTRLREAGFKELGLDEKWRLKKGGRYFTSKNNSALIAFNIGEEDLDKTGFKLIGSHTDSPGFRIKPNPEMVSSEGYFKLNTEVYGGPILNTWLDRPLSLAGRVFLRGEDILNPREELINIDRSLMIIPNLAIHMNREVNSGFKLNTQDHTLPLVALVEEEFEREDYLIKLLADELDVDSRDILDFDLYLYAREKGELIGLNEEFISIGKLDNLAMFHASLRALIDNENPRTSNIIVAFDNEEVGSTTKQGAASPMLEKVLDRIGLSLGLEREDYLIALEKSFLISSDMAHAVHPNFMDKADPTNRPVINGGPSIKLAANQAYTTDGFSASVYESICRSIDVPVQKFVNRSDLRGGSTIGPISSSQLDINSVDIGNPILGMHSVRELGGVSDHYYVYRSFKEFFTI